MRIFAIISVLFVLQACSTRLPPAGIRAYDQCHYDQAIEIFSKAHKKEKDQLLYDLAILSSAVHSGDSEVGKKAGLRAQQLMWSYEGKAEGAASLASSEALRIYKGEPFEKAVASIYLGILYYNDKDFDNARAAFSKALLAIKSKKENVDEDFALPYFFLTKNVFEVG